MNVELLSIIALVGTEQSKEKLELHLKNLSIKDFKVLIVIDEFFEQLEKHCPHVVIYEEEYFSQEILIKIKEKNTDVHLIYLADIVISAATQKILTHFLSFQLISKNIDQFQLLQKLNNILLAIKDNFVEIQQNDVNRMGTLKVSLELKGISESHLLLDGPLKFQLLKNYHIEGEWLEDQAIPNQLMTVDIQTNYKELGFLTSLYLRNLGEPFLMKIRRRE